MPPLSPLASTSVSGTSAGVIGNILGDIGANASRQAGTADGAGSAGSKGNIGDLLGAIADAFGGLFGSLQEQSAIGQSPSLFSTKAAAPPDGLSGLQSTLEAISQKLS